MIRRNAPERHYIYPSYIMAPATHDAEQAMKKESSCSFIGPNIAPVFASCDPNIPLQFGKQQIEALYARLESHGEDDSVFVPFMVGFIAEYERACAPDAELLALWQLLYPRVQPVPEACTRGEHQAPRKLAAETAPWLDPPPVSPLFMHAPARFGTIDDAISDINAAKALP